ncbi:class I SAM-dependent methyltransferase [Streptomyces sp. NPDC051597]|uniref:class I SAM-dependent methyltransferase n=1 Tax=Streptomyces sp. NPDC051597 TaxID=3155049 RepID=UPI00342DF9D3
MAFIQGYEFDAMSRRPLYGDVTQRLVDLCACAPGSVVADVGCGSGRATELLLERFPQLGSVVGIDPSAHELALAEERLRDNPRARFVTGRAQDVGAVVGPVDAVVLSNVMHQIPRAERPSVLRGCHDLLAPGGRLALNTLFYEGAVLPESRRFYAAWLHATRTWLRGHGGDLVLVREAPVALETLTPADHEALMTEAGFVSVTSEEDVYPWTLEDWQALCGYSVFVEGATGLTDVELGSRALTAALHTVFRDLGLRQVPRRWLFVHGTRQR